MKLGAHIFLTDESITIGEISRELEERDTFDSLWLSEHTHIPTSRETVWPLEGEDIPGEYLRMIDPFVGLTVAAARTRDLIVGTAVCLVAQHDPIVLAKTVATLDLVSGGRFILGVGLGWNLEELRNHGVDPAFRRSVVREKMLAMEGLWREDAFGFNGDYVKFDEAWSWPKPAGSRPTVLMGGGSSPRALRHIAEYADGWMPDMSFMSVDALVDSIGEMRTTAELAGRNPAAMRVTVMACPPDPAVVEALAAAGVERCVFLLPSAGSPEVLEALDRIESAIAEAAGSGGAA